MLGSLIWFAAAAVPLSTVVEVSPAVRAAVAKYGSSGPEAERQLEALLAAGDGSAGALLGELLMLPGRRGGPDLVRACNYSEKAGDHPEALHNLATCYFSGGGRPRDPARARHLYRRASDLGLAKAACALGNMLIRGDGGAKDGPGGVDLCRRGADAGDPDAQTDYGGYLLLGGVVARDPVAARRYLTLAAQRKQRNAAFLLGQIYWNGDGIAKDKAEAARWWSVAYEAGRLDAARLLAMEAVGRLLAAIQAKQPSPPAAEADARRWLAIAAEKDPDPANRREAADMLSKLSQLVRN
jgi:uncharacterized protein